MKQSEFGRLAVLYAKKIEEEKIKPTIEGWKHLAKELGFTKSKIDKGCPRNAFLGLCSLGLIKGITKGNYTTSKKNSNYAKEAVRILKEDNSLCNNPNELWTKIPGAPKTHNGQMNVVCALWKAEIIN